MEDPHTPLTGGGGMSLGLRRAGGGDAACLEETSLVVLSFRRLFFRIIS